MDAWINGGYFVFRHEIFDYIRPGEELVEQPFQRLIAERRLSAHDYQGFWRCIDTFKDLQALESMYAQGNAPWEVWHRDAADGEPRPEPLGTNSPPLGAKPAPHRRRARRVLGAMEYRQA